jgi:hypothetical protein
METATTLNTTTKVLNIPWIFMKERLANKETSPRRKDEKANKYDISSNENNTNHNHIISQSFIEF